MHCDAVRDTDHWYTVLQKFVVSFCRRPRRLHVAREDARASPHGCISSRCGHGRIMAPLERRLRDLYTRFLRALGGPSSMSSDARGSTRLRRSSAFSVIHRGSSGGACDCLACAHVPFSIPPKRYTRLAAVGWSSPLLCALFVVRVVGTFGRQVGVDQHPDAANVLTTAGLGHCGGTQAKSIRPSIR